MFILEDPYCIDVEDGFQFVELKSHPLLPSDLEIKINDQALNHGVQCGCFGAFAHQCHLNNIPFATVEFRHAMRALMRAGRPIKDAVSSVLDPIIQDLRNNQDHELREFYDAKIKELQEDDLYQICMGAHRKQVESERDPRVEKDIQLLGSGLLECQIMRYVYHNKAQPTIFIGAGGTHIRNIEPMLRALGYQKIKTVGSGFVADQNSAQGQSVDLRAIFSNNQPGLSSFFSYKKLFALGALIACGYCAYKFLPSFQFPNLLWQYQ